ncbi:MAG: hypothetical protein ACI94D_002741, partial [Neolewinella sp.]
ASTVLPPLEQLTIFQAEGVGILLAITCPSLVIPTLASGLGWQVQARKRQRQQEIRLMRMVGWFVLKYGCIET